MSEHTLTTVFYKYRPWAKGFIGLYILLVLVAFGLMLDNVIIFLPVFAVVLVGPPLVAAVKEKSVFNIRVWDDRQLILSTNYIKVGDIRYNVETVEAIGIYLGGYEGFCYTISKKNGSSKRKGVAHGDDNTLSIRFQGQVQTYTFQLKDFNEYVLACHLIDEWKPKKGKSFASKELFSRDFIRKQLRQDQAIAQYHGEI